MFQRFNPQAREAMERAASKARAQGNDRVEPEHLLASLAEDGESSFNSVIHGMKGQGGSTGGLADMIKAKAKAPPPRPGEVAAGAEVDPVFSASCRRVLAYTVEEADRLGHKRVGTSHFLLGLLRSTERGGEILKRLGLSLEDARGCVLELLGEECTGEDDTVPASLFFELDRRAREAERTIEERVGLLEKENRVLQQHIRLLAERINRVESANRRSR